jgi:nitroreductase
MTFLDLAQKRYSVRAYQPRDVDDQTIMKVLEAGRVAPSACNNQPWHFVVVRSDEGRARLKKVYDRAWFLAAPVIIAVCIDRSRSWKRADKKEYGDVDAAIAMDHMVLAATELGLGTCWIGAFNADAARTALNIPANVDPVVLTPLGYPADAPRPRKRNDMDAIVRWERFS